MQVEVEVWRCGGVGVGAGAGGGAGAGAGAGAGGGGDLTSDGWLEHCEVLLKRMSSFTSTATALRMKEKKRLRWM